MCDISLSLLCLCLSLSLSLFTPLPLRWVWVGWIWPCVCWPRAAGRRPPPPPIVSCHSRLLTHLPCFRNSTWLSTAEDSFPCKHIWLATGRRGVVWAFHLPIKGVVFDLIKSCVEFLWNEGSLVIFGLSYPLPLFLLFQGTADLNAVFYPSTRVSQWLKMLRLPWHPLFPFFNIWQKEEGQQTVVKKHILQVSTQQMVVLMLFNRRPQFTYEVSSQEYKSSSCIQIVLS